MSFDELKARLAAAWGKCDWSLAAGWLDPMHDHLVRSLAPQPGERWLDVATGTGATALRASVAGADVSAQDLSPGMIERARRFADEQSLAIHFDVGDAEALPYEDASFDVVASAVGLVLTPSHRAIAREVTRVCRRGGRIGFTAWRPNVGYFDLLGRFQPPPEPGADDRRNWGREEYVEERLGADFDLRFEEGDNPFRGESGDEIWERQLAGVGTIRTLYESLDESRRSELHDAMVEYFESERVGDEIRAPAPYLLSLGTRR